MAVNNPNVNVKCLTVPGNYVKGFASAITSSSTIVITSGANTIHVTEVLISADAAMAVDLRSEATAIARVYLAAQGGLVWPLETPLVLNSAQSLTFIQSASGSCSVTAVGYTIV